MSSCYIHAENKQLNNVQVHLKKVEPIESY